MDQLSCTVTVVRGEDGSPDHLVLKGAAERAPVSA